ncbi:hypothetical protein LCGC14_0960160 [marine sediment metagenome]|uniref:Uncharacterized protein n=1 Tax=marine sediment metagenome TaxID=412755 RepID=A0A0F9NEN9_9ZZZZ
MKKFKIDLSKYAVTVKVNKRNDKGGIELVTEEIVYPIKDNLHQWLRLPGIFKDGVQIVDACDLAKQIRDAGDDIVLDEHEMGLLKTAMNKLIAQEPDPRTGAQALGGTIHEECIRRIFKAEEVS